jgi:hypothetical protein
LAAEEGAGSNVTARVPERWRWALPVLAIAVASRLFSIAVIVIQSSRGDGLAGAFGHSDVEWYMRIATDGYHGYPVQFSPTGRPQHDFAFYPAWAMVLRGVSWLPAPVELVGAAIANVLFVAALVLVYRLFADRFGDRVAMLGAALIAFSPPAYVFSMAYTESMFLLLAAGSFVLRGSLWRGPVGALAMLTRVAGVALIASAFVEAILTRGRDRRGAIAALLGGLLALAAWLGYVAWLTGDPLGYSRGSPNWIAHGGWPQLVITLQDPSIRGLLWMAAYLVPVVASVALLRHHRELAIYSLSALALALLPGGNIMSFPRYAMIAFPAFAMIAVAVLRVGDRAGRWVAWLAVLGSAVTQLVFAGFVFDGRFHP